MLRSVKRYFFTDHGDFFDHFLDLSFNDLRLLPASQASPDKLQVLFDMAAKSCASTNDDVYSDCIHVSLAKTTLVEQLRRILDIMGDIPDATVGKPGSMDDLSVLEAGESNVLTGMFYTGALLNIT